MGDRANVYIHEDDNPGIYVYTHWSGTELPQMVKNALESTRAQNRLTDPSYLTRILIEELTDQDRGSETGWGISTTVGDGEDRIVDVKVSYTAVPYVTLQGYGYRWDNMPSDPFNICNECGQTLPD